MCSGDQRAHLDAGLGARADLELADLGASFSISASAVFLADRTATETAMQRSPAEP
jgi:hypothetical protein